MEKINLLKFIMKEASVLVAFVVLGGLLLLSLWVTHNVQTSVLKEFKDSQVSVVLKEGAEPSFKTVLQKSPEVIRYEIYSANKNKDRLGSLYPELRNVIAPLDTEFFPSSALVTVGDPQKFLARLGEHPELFESQILHEPPTQLRQLLNVLNLVLLGLWLLTLTLVLYFNLERLTQREEARWSLMKMLGSKPSRLFIPLWTGQALRITVASISAIALAALISRQVRTYFIWDWHSLSTSVWAGFFLISLALTTIISFALFFAKYRRISIG